MRHIDFALRQRIRQLDAHTCDEIVALTLVVTVRDLPHNEHHILQGASFSQTPAASGTPFGARALQVCTMKCQAAMPFHLPGTCPRILSSGSVLAEHILPQAVLASTLSEEGVLAHSQQRLAFMGGLRQAVHLRRLSRQLVALARKRDACAVLPTGLHVNGEDFLQHMHWLSHAHQQGRRSRNISFYGRS